MALHDLVGRATGRPAHALLGGKQRSRMAILGVISTGELASDLREAERKKADGYSAFKIKVGIDKPLIDGERTRRVCEILGTRGVDLVRRQSGLERRRSGAIRARGGRCRARFLRAAGARGRYRRDGGSGRRRGGYRDRRRREHPLACGYSPASRARRGAWSEPQDHQARRHARRDGGGPAVRPARASTSTFPPRPASRASPVRRQRTSPPRCRRSRGA